MKWKYVTAGLILFTLIFIVANLSFFLFILKILIFIATLLSLLGLTLKFVSPKLFKKYKVFLLSILKFFNTCLSRIIFFALSYYETPELIRKASKFVVQSKNKQLNSIILQLLSEITEQSCIDEVCTTWADTRHQDLANLLVKKSWVASAPLNVRILSALKVNQPNIVINSEGIVEPLLNAIQDKDSEIANLAGECAISLTNPDDIDYICCKWAETRDELLGQIICGGKYIAQQSIELRVLTALKVAKLEVIRDGDTEIVEPLLKAFNDKDAEIFGNASECAISLTNPETIDYICRLAIEQNHQVAYQIAIKAQYAPHEPNQRALFYFLTEQWNKYESLDYEYSLLQKVYELGNGKLRKQIADKAKQAGRVAWVQIVAGGRKDKRLEEMTDAEWETTLNVLSSSQQWDEMWWLAQNAPAIWSKQLLQQLNQAAWLPKVAQEQVGFERLNQLAEKCLEKIQSMEWLTSRRTIIIEGLAICLSPNSKILASINNEKTISLWQIPDGQLLSTLTNPNSETRDISFSPDGKILASINNDKTISLWQIPDGQLLSTLTNPNSETRDISFSPDGKILASVSQNGTISLWQIPDGQLLSTTTGYVDWTRGMIFSPDGKILCDISSEKIIKLWRIPDGQLLATLNGHTDKILRISFSPDGKILASSSYDKTIKLWQMPDGQLLATLDTGNTGFKTVFPNIKHLVTEIVFSPDGTILASRRSNGVIGLWRMPDGQFLATLSNHSDINKWNYLSKISFSPDGTILACCSLPQSRSDYTIKLWDRTSFSDRISLPKSMATLSGHTDEILSICFSPDSKMLASFSRDKTIRLWQMPDGELLTTFAVHTDEILSICFSPDSKILASFSLEKGKNKTARLWSLASVINIPIEQLYQQNREWVQKILQDNKIPKEEKHWLDFTQALMNWHRRFDVEVEDIPRLISTSEFDIEIEG